MQGSEPDNHLTNGPELNTTMQYEITLPCIPYLFHISVAYIGKLRENIGEKRMIDIRQEIVLKIGDSISWGPL